MAHKSGNKSWQNAPSVQTPINAAALENMENAIDGVYGIDFINIETDGTTLTVTTPNQVVTVNIKGDPGEKGDAFTFDDFTDDQLAQLKGSDGEKGEPGESLTYESLSEKDKEDLTSRINAQLSTGEQENAILVADGAGGIKWVAISDLVLSAEEVEF